MTVLQGSGLTRRFGRHTAVDGVDLAVDAGEVVGLLGANGAGKTTLIRMLLGLLAPSSGQVALLGKPPGRRSRHEIGYVPQHLGLYPDLTVQQNRAFHRAAYGLGVGDDDPEPDPARLVGDLSLGAQRRLAFGLAMAHDPRLLVLDEPTSGVGPLGRAAMWEAITAGAEQGRGVLVTTHHLAEAEQCDRLVVMATGRVVAAGTLTEVIGDATTVVVRGTDAPATLTALERAGMLPTLAAGGVAVPAVRLDEVLAAVEDAGLAGDGTAVVTRPSTLEERFVELVTA